MLMNINYQNLIPRFLIALLMMLVLFIFNAQYVNASSYTGEITATKLNVRTTASVNSSILGQVSKGQEVVILSETNGFGKINYNNKIGYVSMSYVKKSTINQTSSTNIATFKGYANSTTLNVRSTADTYSTILGKIKKDVVYEFKEYDTNWYSFNYNGKTGYVYNLYVTKVSSSTNTDTKQLAASSGLSKGVTTAALNIRKTASFSSATLSTISKGTELNYKVYDKTWHYVEVNGVKGYIYNIYVKPTSATVSNPSNPATSTNTSDTSKAIGTFTTTANLNVRVNANALSSILGTIAKGSKVEVHEKLSNGWNKLIYNGNVGYVSASYLKEVPDTAPVKPTTPTTPTTTVPKVIGIYTTTSNLNVRESANALSTMLGTLTKGTKVEVYEKLSNGWNKLNYNGKVGYVNASYLKEHSEATIKPVENFETYIVNTNVLNVREKADALSAKVGAVSINQQVKVYEKLTNGWFEIDFNGKPAYVNGYYLYKSGTTTNIGSASGLKGKTIVLDAGHGGSDPGALGKSFNEKTFNLSMALKLKKKLENAGVNVILTRSTDSYIGLANRAYLANDKNADLFISIHANSNSNKSANGIDSFYYNSNDTRGKDSYNLAKGIQNSLINSTGAKDRGVQSAAFTVIALTKMPSVLLELGFISNPTEHDKLGSSTYQTTLTNAIYSGIYKYFE